MKKIESYSDEQLVEEYKKQLMDEYNNPEKYDEPGDMPSYYLWEELMERKIEVVIHTKHEINITWSKQQ